MGNSNNKHNIKKSSVLFNKKGMTMAEMLMTVAIIIILMGVGFIALFNYQRSLAQIERDGYAKELFIAAQNHLTMAKGEGYYGVTDAVSSAADAISKAEKSKEIYGEPGNLSGEKGVYYFLVTDGDIIHDTDPNKTLLDQMLPFGSIDDTVRKSGSYIIRYQPSTATVLDVFYCTTGGDRFDHTLTTDEYETVCGLRDLNDGTNHKNERRTFGTDKSVLGWYGGAGLVALPNAIKKPYVKVYNSDMLYVEVTDEDSQRWKPEDGIKYALVLTGVESKSKKVIYLDEEAKLNNSRCISPKEGDKWTFQYIIDDITEPNMHFYDLVKDTVITSGSGEKVQNFRFKMGEDIRIEVAAYSSKKLAGIAYSEPEVTNSLYESISEIDEANPSAPRTAFISSFRHLENLEEDISKTGLTGDITSTTKQITFSTAEQTKDLVWTDSEKSFLENTKSNGSIYLAGDLTPMNGYYPVSYESPLVYEGLRHSISNVSIVADQNNNTGLFGLTSTDASTLISSIRNLEIIDPTVKGSSGNTGSLIGSAINTTIFNVIAYSEKQTKGERDRDDSKAISVSATGGNLGGLVGSMTGGSTRYCAASLIVNGGNNSGGLVGNVAGNASIESSYSGGHTDNGEYYYNGDKDDPLYNISAETNAGGLIGQSGGATIKYCYSTCSASATNAGGFIGNAVGTTRVEDSYCTGLVSGDSNNAFIGSGQNISASRSYFYEIINEIKDESKITYKGSGINSVEPFDKDKNEFEKVTPTSWNPAKVYDRTLSKYYNDKYCFKTVTQLKQKSGGGDIGTDNFVNTHYGDWPAPEVFIVNE